MKNLILIFFVVLIHLIVSCESKRLKKSEIKEKAFNVIELLKKENINIFKVWNFYYRGGEVWTKETNYKNNYFEFYGRYLKRNDTIKLYIRKNDLYSTDINLKMKIDTSLFNNGLVFNKTQNEKIQIVTNNYNNLENTIIGENLNFEEVFYKPYAISKLDTLSNLKNKIDVCRIKYTPRIGDFIRFFLTYQDVLFYVDDKSTIKYKYWLEKFSEENKIQEKWYLIHYDKPQYDL